MRVLVHRWLGSDRQSACWNIQQEEGKGGHSVDIFQAELVGITQCALKILEDGTSQQVNIYCYCKGVLGALSGHSTRSKLVWECHNTLDRLGEKTGVKLNWVPGNSGVKGNMVAHNLAKMGSGMDLICPKPVVTIGRNLIASAVRGWVEKETAVDWDRQEGCRHSKCFVSSDSKKDWEKDILGLNRRKAKT